MINISGSFFPVENLIDMGRKEIFTPFLSSLIFKVRCEVENESSSVHRPSMAHTGLRFKCAHSCPYSRGIVLLAEIDTHQINLYTTLQLTQIFEFNKCAQHSILPEPVDGKLTDPPSPLLPDSGSPLWWKVPFLWKSIVLFPTNQLNHVVPHTHIFSPKQ